MKTSRSNVRVSVCEIGVWSPVTALGKLVSRAGRMQLPGFGFTLSINCPWSPASKDTGWPVVICATRTPVLCRIASEGISGATRCLYLSVLSPGPPPTTTGTLGHFCNSRTPSSRDLNAVQVCMLKPRGFSFRCEVSRELLLISWILLTEPLIFQYLSGALFALVFGVMPCY